jgi:hypothetical protein
MYALLAGGFVVPIEKVKFAPNSALLIDAYLALRASSGAAKRGR